MCSQRFVVNPDEQLIYEIVQAARNVHVSLGPGFLESVYCKAFLWELRDRILTAEREKIIKIVYGSRVVGRHYLDLVVENRVIVELKACRGIIPLHHAQMRSYLTATSYPFGLIINFGLAELEWERVQP